MNPRRLPDLAGEADVSTSCGFNPSCNHAIACASIADGAWIAAKLASARASQTSTKLCRGGRGGGHALLSLRSQVGVRGSPLYPKL